MIQNSKLLGESARQQSHRPALRRPWITRDRGYHFKFVIRMQTPATALSQTTDLGVRGSTPLGRANLFNNYAARRDYPMASG
jgi:hypothetical protein